jgi:hypothetical protein
MIRKSELPMGDGPTPAGAEPSAARDWTDIRRADCPFILEERALAVSMDELRDLLDRVPFTLRAAGTVSSLCEGLELPPALVRDIATLADRFATVMGCAAVRLRFEGIDSNACKKVHADYTDVRLVTTYAGPGSLYAPQGDPGCLEAVLTGWVALFKGRLFHPDHPPCLHCSPSIEGTGEQRLVLVIDTPEGFVAGA